MNPRKNYLKRTPLKHKPRRPRAEGMDDEAFKAWLRTWPCYVCLWIFCAEEEQCSPYSFFRVLEDPERRTGYASYTKSVCGPTEAAHVGHRGLGQKCSDREAMPLGRKHHEHATAGGGPESHHSLGKKFWFHHGLERETVIAILNRLYQQETGK